MWLRLYTEVRRDRKLRRLSPSHRWLWVVLLTIAKESPNPGWLLISEGVPVTLEDLADEAAIGTEEVAEGIEAFMHQNMLEEVDGVWHLQNWDKRQFISDSSTDRVKRYRQRQSRSNSNNDETLQERYSNDVETPPENRVQSTDTDIRKRDIEATPYREIADLYSKLCPSLPQIRTITDKRKQQMRSRWKKYPDLSIFEELFQKTEASDFLSGRSGKWTGCNFDWLLKEANMVKVLEGSYDNQKGDKADEKNRGSPERKTERNKQYSKYNSLFNAQRSGTGP